MKIADLIGVALKHQATIAQAVGVDVCDVERACRGAELVDEVLGVVVRSTAHHPSPEPPVLASVAGKPPSRRRKAATDVPRVPRAKRQRKPRKAPSRPTATVRVVEGRPDPDAWRDAARRVMKR